MTTANIMYAMGMSRSHGTLMTPSEHLRQSVVDILTTPLGSRLMRRSYGSLLPMLIDEPLNLATKLKLMSAIATALVQWEPRLKIRQVQLSINPDATNSTGNTGVDMLIDLRLADNARFSTSLALARGAA